MPQDVYMVPTPPIRSINLPRTPSRAFSLLEILIVVGILALLIALAVISFRVVGTVSREKVTDNQLENCKSLLNEYELTNSAAGLFPTPLVVTGHWVAPAIVTPPKSINATTCSTAAVSTGNDGQILQDTARTIGRLRSVPKNRSALEAMASERVEAITYPVLTVPADPASPPTYSKATLPEGSAVVLLDGDGHPIYFVPGGGLTGVFLAYRGTGDRQDPANYDKPGTTITSPDRRPFWVSPGPDGDLRTGDDNIYSFGK